MSPLPSLPAEPASSTLRRQGDPPVEPPVPGRPLPGTPRRAVRTAGTVAVVVLARWRDDARLWGLWRLIRQRGPLQGTPGLGFSKVLGSGRGGGFGMAPGLQHHGLFLVFDTEDHARGFVDGSPLLAAYRDHAAEWATAVLRATASRGNWSGAAMAVTAAAPAQGPLAALTRASIRPRHAAEFWRHSPAAQNALARSPGCHLAVGLGEAPLLRQATFSLWSGVDAMSAYARHGAHGQAARASMDGGWFSETMFVRFAPLALAGHWKGCDLGAL
jgi:spheroidene monooxygenase